MSNYVEFENKIAFHPGYYIKEYIEELGLTQEDFAIRLGTTPKNISYIIRGEQSISIDIANKLCFTDIQNAFFFVNSGKKFNHNIKF